MVSNQMKFVLAHDHGVSFFAEFNVVVAELRGPTSFSMFPAARRTHQEHPQWAHSVMSDRDGQEVTFLGRYSSSDIVFFYDVDMLQIMKSDSSGKAGLDVAVCFRSSNTTSVVRVFQDWEYTPAQLDYFKDLGGTVATPHPFLTALFSTIINDGFEEQFEK